MHSQKTKKEKKKQPEDKEATRNMQKWENDIKEAQVEKGLITSLIKRNKYIKKQPCKFLRTESLNTRRPKNKP